MSLEADVFAYVDADATLAAILTGDIYASQTIGENGITRTATPGAFDANGWLKPCGLVRERDEIPDGMIRDEIERSTSVRQVVEIWLYQERTYAAINQAASRLFVLLQGHQFSGYAPAVFVGTLTGQRDQGALKDASLARMEWEFFSVKS